MTPKTRARKGRRVRRGGGKERKEKERKRKERKEKERKGKERKGKEKKGKERKGKRKEIRFCEAKGKIQHVIFFILGFFELVVCF